MKQDNTENKLSDAIIASVKRFITAVRRAKAADRTAGQVGAYVIAEIMHTMGSAYDEAVAVVKAQLKQAGEAERNVNRSRELVPFAFSNFEALAAGDALEWPTMREARAILARSEISVTEFFENGDDWNELVAEAGNQAKLELERAAAKRGDDDYSATAEDISSRVAAFKRNNESAPAAPANQTDDEAVLAVIQLRRKGMTPEGKAAAIKLLS